MTTRIPLQVIEGRIILNAVIENPLLRVRHHLLDFVIETGSMDSFLSQKDVAKLQISISDRASIGEVDFGGSRFKQVKLPPFSLHLLREDKAAINLQVSLKAIKTTS